MKRPSLNPARIKTIPRELTRAPGKLKHVRIHHISMFCMYIAALFVALGLLLWLKPVSSRGMLRTTAKVTANNARITPNSSGIQYYAVFEFTGQDGKTYRFNGEPYTTPRHKPGDMVRVAYSKANPRFAKDISYHRPGAGAMASFTFALLAVLTALGFGWHHHLDVKHRNRMAARTASAEPGDS